MIDLDMPLLRNDLKTSGLKGETIPVIACRNAEDVLIPTACVMKGKNKNNSLRMRCSRYY